MKFTILLSMLFDLLAKGKATASYFAEKHSVSTRTVYRYVEILATHLPIEIIRGRGGGILLADHYKLPKGHLSADEYSAIVEALELAYAQKGEEKFVEAKRKISAKKKSETRNLAVAGSPATVLLDGGVFGDTGRFFDKLRMMEECINARHLVEIVHYDRKQVPTVRTIEPHLIAIHKGVCCVYAFCRVSREWRMFKLGCIGEAYKQAERFNRRPIDEEQLASLFRLDEEKTVRVQLKISQNALVRAQERLGAENLYCKDGIWYGEGVFRDDETLPQKIFALGSGISVIAPNPLRRKVKELLAATFKQYS